MADPILGRPQPAAPQRPPREGLPPFPTGGGQPAGGVFSRLPRGMGDRPIPQPPDIPSPGVVLRTGERFNRSSVIDPVNVFAYGTAAGLVYLLVRRAQATGAEPVAPRPAAPPAVNVSPELQQQRFEEERRRLQEASRMDLTTEIPFVLAQADEFLFGKEKSFALSKLLGVFGQGGKVQVEAVKRFLLGSTAGQGEEAQLSRMNDDIRRQRELMAGYILAALSVAARGGTSGEAAALVAPVHRADP